MTTIKDVHEILDVKLHTETKRGMLLAHKAKLKVTPTRIFFAKAPFALKDEIKAMAGAKWHGYEEINPVKQWSVLNSPRNWFQLKYLMNQNPYAWFEQPLKEFHYRDYYMDGVKVSPRDHQFLLANSGLTYHYQIWAAEMGTGKTLAAMMVMEHSGVKDWFWVGPKKAIENIEIEFEKWGLPSDYIPKMTTYERLLTYMRNRKPGDPIPQGIIFDESSRLKSPDAQRSKAAQDIADLIREEYGHDGYVILMSGTPSPKSPLDWWKQCEIAWPGFLREGSPKALKERLAFLVKQTFDDATVSVLKGWKDDELKCATCGEYEDEGPHSPVDVDDEWGELGRAEEWHKYEPGSNEVSFMYERLSGLVHVLHKKDVLDLPDKVYEEDICEPNPSTLRAAQALMEAAPNAMTGMTWLREVSDGFMYKDVENGKAPCNICKGSEREGEVMEWFDPEDPRQGFEQTDFLDEDFVKRLETRWIKCKQCSGSQEMTKYKRITREIPCPKEEKLKDRLEQCEETGRIVIFAGFKGSLDRIQKLCMKQHWDVVRCDGDGYRVWTKDGEQVRTDKPLAYWKDWKNSKVAFVAHPQSGGLSLNLTESRMAVFYSNDFNPESRSQAEDRVHRMGMDENRGCKIVDIYHLPSDNRVRQILRDNRKLELMTMGEFQSLQLQVRDAAT
jgi:hypothetical protein